MKRAMARNFWRVMYAKDSVYSLDRSSNEKQIELFASGSNVKEKD